MLPANTESGLATITVVAVQFPVKLGTEAAPLQAFMISGDTAIGEVAFGVIVTTTGADSAEQPPGLVTTTV